MPVIRFPLPNAGSAGMLLGIPAIRIPYPTQPVVVLSVFGVTKDSNGNPLGGCTVHLFRTVDDVEVDRTVSDANGNYMFTTGAATQTYYVLAYLPGSSDVAGTTVNTLLAT